MDRTDERARDELFARHRARLVRMVERRLDARLRARVDASDVVQEALFEAHRRFGGYRARRPMPVGAWLRFLTSQALAAARRRHFAAQARDAQRERGERELATTANDGAAEFVATNTSPTLASRRNEIVGVVAIALERLDAQDREILVLRHFDGLSNEDAARALRIEPAAASKRFIRALARLSTALSGLRAEVSA